MPWIYVISDLNGKEILEAFYEKELQKTNQTQLRIVIKRKGDKLFVKLKGSDNSLTSWIDKKKILLLKMSYVPEPPHSKN